MDLRLRSNEARRPFPRKPSGRRVFCPWPALARSLGIVQDGAWPQQPAAGMRPETPSPPWPQPKSLAAAPLAIFRQAPSRILAICGVPSQFAAIKQF